MDTMHLIVNFCGWALLTWLAFYAAVIGLELLTGFVRAVSLHSFLSLLVRTEDGQLCPFHKWYHWPLAFAKSCLQLAGWPTLPADRSYTFNTRSGLLTGIWVGVGQWQIKHNKSGDAALKQAIHDDDVL